MPYVANQDLPPSVRDHLPAHAQTIYREAFNHAWRAYAHYADREAVAHRVAWAAVKRKYRKLNSEWVSLDEQICRVKPHPARARGTSPGCSKPLGR